MTIVRIRRVKPPIRGRHEPPYIPAGVKPPKPAPPPQAKTSEYKAEDDELSGYDTENMEIRGDAPADV